MEFRELKNIDVEKLNEIVKLEKESFCGSGNVDTWILKSLINYGKVFVIEENNKIVCIAEYLQCFAKNEVFLYGICTHKEFQKKGYAKKILQESENILKKLKYKAILLTVAPENETAIKLYQKVGFSMEKFLQDEYGKGIDRYLFRKSL